MKHENDENDEKSKNDEKTSFWKKESDFSLEQEKPMSIVRNVAFEMKKRNLSSVLDLGCGQGRNSIFLAKQNFFITGIDYNLKDLLMFKQYITTHNLAVNLLQSDVSQLPFKENMFDVVLCLHVLTYVTEQARSLVAEEVKRVLKPQGLFCAVERSPKDPMYKQGEEIEKETYLCEGLAHHFFSSEELKFLFSPMDIKVLEDSRTIDTSHGAPHVHGMWVLVALNT